MNNGQMSIASIPTAMPVPAREAPAAAAEALEGAPKSGSTFAKLLSGQQAPPQKNAPAEPEQTEQPEAEIGKKPDFVEAASLMALAGYVQLTAMPDPTAPPVEPLSVDMQQNATMAIEQPPIDMVLNRVMVTEPLFAQQQPAEATRTAVATVLTGTTEAETTVPATVASEMSKTIVPSPALPFEVTFEVENSEHRTNTVSGTGADKTLTEALTIRQRHEFDPNMKTIVDLNTVEGAASKLQLKGTDTISMAGSEIYDCFDNSQGDPDGENSNPDFTQNMSGHLAVEQHKVSAASTRSAPFEPLRQGVSEQVLPQIKERLDQYDLKPGKQQITLTLSPDTLGELKMNLNLQGGKLSIEIVTENRSVRDVIVQHADALKESLARQNITMESFDVTTGGKGSGNQGQNQNAWRELMQQQQQQQQQQQYWTTPRGYGVAPADLPSEVAMQQRHQGQSMLDIHY